VPCAIREVISPPLFVFLHNVVCVNVGAGAFVALIFARRALPFAGVLGDYTCPSVYISVQLEPPGVTQEGIHTGSFFFFSGDFFCLPHGPPAMLPSVFSRKKGSAVPAPRQQQGKTNKTLETKGYIVAIDLGTSSTAYSWRSPVDPNPCVGVPDMAPNEDIAGKSPTSILIGGSTMADGDFRPTGVEAYGRVAERCYATADTSLGAQLFRRFKIVRQCWRGKGGVLSLLVSQTSFHTRMGLEHVGMGLNSSSFVPTCMYPTVKSALQADVPSAYKSTCSILAGFDHVPYRNTKRVRQQVSVSHFFARTDSFPLRARPCLHPES